MDRDQAIQWDFHRTATVFAAALRELERDGEPRPLAASSPADRRPPSLLELRRWEVVGRRQAAGGEQRRGGYDGGEVYLAHPAVLVPLAPVSDDTTACPSDAEADPPGDAAEELYADETLADEAACARDGGGEHAEWTFSVVFHDVWCVPTLYFTVHREDGSSLRRQEVLDVLLRDRPRSWSADEEEALWEFVSREEHPATGRPAFFLHPCRTAELMQGLLADRRNGNGGGDDERCPLLSWLSLVLPAVGCKVSSLAFRRALARMRELEDSI